MSVLQQLIDAVKLLPMGGPGICNIAITNVCNAKCDFCNYARDKMFVKERLWVDYDRMCQGLDILYERGIRYVTLVGGEPTLHPKLKEIVAYTVNKGMRPSIVTNGSRLGSTLINELKISGLKTLFISIDSPSNEEHEKNRGLPNVCDRIKEANQECKRLGIKTIASVTINKLIEDFPELLDSLKELGFETVNFAYPKRVLNSSALSFSQTSELINYSTDELVQALEKIKSLKGEFRILNSSESLAEIVRFVRQEKQIYPCVGGYKYFYVDYHLDIYRCDYWPTKIGSIFEFRDRPFVRDRCTKCMSGCYRDASVLIHPAVSVGDALGDLRQGKLLSAIGHLGKRSNFLSLKTLIQEWSTLKKLAKTHSQGDF
ncbi:MAG: radical SAM protein [Nostoc sp.]